ncbi:PREDICTED: 39S ribosomal protein L22, mitochondrial isoform X5 [Myotis brandtii]|uniref:39S ribosomal protein L22, mitochondrial isoform X5 n=1 Tax=Myotis brandtii TaxID=109478 RepID=UPI000703F8A9|nr:PREDICTED: 39S ribosomal protein L22, mitochondrial isoform X5 [Myotis brandtii]
MRPVQTLTELGGFRRGEEKDGGGSTGPSGCVMDAESEAEAGPGEIYHCRRQIKYSRDKMWYLAKLIRGMSIDQALAQLEFSDKKGAQIIKEILLEAQEMAVRDHNVEFRSNLYIAESTSGRGQYLKRIRYHGRGRFGIMEKVYCHYFVKLVEGPPPLPEPPKTAVTHAKEYIQQLRNRTIIHTL